MRLNNEARENEAVAKALQEDGNSGTLILNKEKKTEEECVAERVEEKGSIDESVVEEKDEERKKWQKGQRTKAKAKRWYDDDKIEETETKSHPLPSIPEPFTIYPNFNIHGEPIIPKEEPIDWDNIKLATFITSLPPMKKQKKGSKKSVPPKTSKKFTQKYPHKPKPQITKDDYVHICDIKEFSRY